MRVPLRTPSLASAAVAGERGEPRTIVRAPPLHSLCRTPSASHAARHARGSSARTRALLRWRRRLARAAHIAAICAGAVCSIGARRFLPGKGSSSMSSGLCSIMPRRCVATCSLRGGSALCTTGSGTQRSRQSRKHCSAGASRRGAWRCWTAGVLSMKSLLAHTRSLDCTQASCDTCCASC
jgi:hypothetical protein